MKFEAVGTGTRKVYAKGHSRADVFRQLQEKFPYEIDTPTAYKKTKVVEQVYPEPMKIIRSR